MAYERIKIKSEAGRCLLCENAPCGSHCPDGFAVADMIRSLRFENPAGAAEKLNRTKSLRGLQRSLYG